VTALRQGCGTVLHHSNPDQGGWGSYAATQRKTRELHTVHTTSPLPGDSLRTLTMSGVHTRCPDEFNDWVPWELIFHLDRFFCIPDTSHQIDYFAFITSRLAAVAFLSGTITLSITMFLLYRRIRRDLRAYHRAEEMWLKMQELENGDSKDEVSVFTSSE
jgi:hypothetical protein